ncbi:hypothetical protein [Candidatus Spyradosoma sp. SGI.093]|uniref:hypothetical protein n=1 Tax=Candidatus Spyradosoma sp. SGI.093 TaxID=3420583 RepID=UPI003D08E68B
MDSKKEQEWVGKFKAARSLLEWRKLAGEFQAASSDETFRWRVFYACLTHFVGSETQGFERQVYEYCLTVFKLFELGLSPERELQLRDEADRRAVGISAALASELGSLPVSEKELLELVRNGKITYDKFVAQSSILATSRAWALLNFILYSGLYSTKYGKAPGNGFSIPLGIAVGSLVRLFCR